MGRRELLIAVAFVALGAIAYQFTAPPAKTNQGFSFARLFNNARQKMQADNAQASFVAHGTLAAAAGLSELRIARFNRGITVIGEARTDIGYDLKVDSTGPDEATALSYAKRSVLANDDLGFALALSADYPSEGSQSSELTLHVPARLSVRLDSSSGHTHLSGLAGVRFDNSAGEATLDLIDGPVTGQFRSGSLTITRASSVDMTLQAVTATFETIAQKVTLTMRAGRGTLTKIGGAIEADATATELTITEPAGAVHVGANSGHITVIRPHAAVDVQGRRTSVDVTIETAVPMTVLTSDEPLDLWFAGAPPAFALDATATDGGAIRSDDPRLSSAIDRTGDNKTTKLSHTFGAGGAAPRVVLRNQRSEIVIGMAK
jgi:hypothetical protein